MAIVRLIGYWGVGNPKHSTPNGSGCWDGIQFTSEPVDDFDYLIVMNSPPAKMQLLCDPRKIWTVVHEPPTGCYKLWHINADYSARTYTCDPELRGPEYIQNQPALGWSLHHDYDCLTKCSPPQKTKQLSWVTSNKRFLKGHRRRMQFLKRIQDEIDFDLFGRGIQPIEHKWDGLAPYRYSLAIENFSNSLYWSEKISDCFLAWTMPIYYGCTHITDYFPAEAMIQIDITAPDVVEQIKAALADDPWPHRLDAIAHARDLILNRYQLMPFLAQQIRQFDNEHAAPTEKQVVSLYPKDLRAPLKTFQLLQHAPREVGCCLQEGIISLLYGDYRKC